MAYKEGRYTILASYQYYDNDGYTHIYVAIESSPGRFRVYVKKDIYDFGMRGFTFYDVLETVDSAKKIGEDTAKKLFPLVAASFEYEG